MVLRSKIILMADNGPMTHDGPPGMVEHIYRGGLWVGARTADGQLHVSTGAQDA